MSVTDQPKPATCNQVKTGHRVGSSILQQAVVEAVGMWAGA
jgi:hypothetical protein